MQRPLHRRLLLVLLSLLLGLLAACGGNGSSSVSNDGTTRHNDSDVSFATEMIPHHAQAIEMAKLAVTKATSKDVVDLANQIQDAQQPEIDTMTAWLESWSESAPDAGMPAMPGMDHGSMDHGSRSGMMTGQEMQQLASAEGRDFDRLWLQLMIEHHQGAVQMAKTEQRDGENADAKALAQDIIAGQEAEITTMKRLL